MFSRFGHSQGAKIVSGIGMGRFGVPKEFSVNILEKITNGRLGSKSNC